MKDSEIYRLIRDLSVAENRQSFRELTDIYLSEYLLEERLVAMIVDQDWQRLRNEGVPIWALKVLVEAHGGSIFDIAASMSKIDREMNSWLIGEMRAEIPLLTMWP